jgi:ferredoxin
LIFEKDFFMPLITLHTGVSFEAPDDKRLILALIDHRVDILHRCGGNARCTTCRVKFIAGEPDRMTHAEKLRLTEREALGKFRLSCQIPCDHDMTVEPLLSMKSEYLDDAGPRPNDTITPPAEWTLKDAPL